MPSGALPMLILRVLQSGSLHGYAIAQRIHILSSEVLASKRDCSTRRCKRCWSRAG
jgi:DNA-binding PadR family transcriptional regulator